ncbi:MAG: DUF2782 domain-containing protein [Zoogloeaceae bacterium]|jgi:hypothetical protein|nr:DUF2782 domain-containing protein [Zoogloeaceae bacterium]
MSFFCRPLSRCLGFFCLACAFAGVSFSLRAEEKDAVGLLPLPDVPPPPTDIRPFDEGVEEPQVTIRREERGTVEEYRIHGRLFKIKVIPEAGLPYYLIDNDGDGHFETHAPTDPEPGLPMWVIGTF